MINPKIFRGLSFEQQATLPSSPQTGDLARDASGLKFYDGSSWQLVGTGGGGGTQSWVKFSVSGGVVTINGSSNVTSVTRASTGVYTVNWTTPFANANYCLSLSSVNNGGAVFFVLVDTTGAGQTTSAVNLVAVDNTYAVNDPNIVYVAVVGS